MQPSEIESDADMGGEDSTGILTGSVGRDAQNLVVTDPVPGSLVLWSPHDELQDTGKRLAVATDLARREREENADSPWWDLVSIFDGEKEQGVPENSLSTLESIPLDLPRTLTHALASTKEPPPMPHSSIGD